jgi:hypothetical protein
MGCHQPTKDYVARRPAEGKTKTEIMGCLKRYIAREAFPTCSRPHRLRSLGPGHARSARHPFDRILSAGARVR